MILLGDFGVGKTTFFHRIRTGHFLEEAHALGQHVSVCEKNVPLKHSRSHPQAQVGAPLPGQLWRMTSLVWLMLCHWNTLPQDGQGRNEALADGYRKLRQPFFLEIFWNFGLGMARTNKAIASMGSHVAHCQTAPTCVPQGLETVG